MIKNGRIENNLISVVVPFWLLSAIIEQPDFWKHLNICLEKVATQFCN